MGREFRISDFGLRIADFGKRILEARRQELGDSEKRLEVGGTLRLRLEANGNRRTSAVKKK